jgi:8-oxo-dGTP diphosphatase
MSGEFPVSTWGDQTVTFRRQCPINQASKGPGAVLVFAFQDSRIVLADIRGRGWCVPSGRTEPGETPEAAARREAMEEAGATLGNLSPFGFMVALALDEREEVLAEAFVTTVERLDQIPESSESVAIRLADRSELQGCYFLWDDLIARIFEAAWDLSEALAGTRLEPLVRRSGLT